MKNLQRVLSALALVFLAAIGLAGGQQSVKPDENLVKGPVVQNVQQDRVTLTWVTEMPAGELRKSMKPPVDLTGTVYHQVEVTGLDAGKHYDYDMNRYGVDAIVHFTTAPSGPAPFSFVVFGDTRTRHEVHKRIVDLILREDLAFVIHTGDLVNNGNNPGDWDKFFEIERDLLRAAAFYPMLGNHEREAPVYAKYFSFPGGNCQRYSFDFGDAHFAFMDTSDGTSTPDFDDQVKWLQTDLSRNKRPLTFVSFHNPLYTVMESRRSSAAKLAERLEPVLLAGGVTAVFGGHDHNYQHHLKAGVHYIVAGGGGAPLYDGTPIPEVTLKFVKTENYVRIRVEGSKAHVEAVDIEGNLIDAFDLTGRGDKPAVPLP